MKIVHDDSQNMHENAQVMHEKKQKSSSLDACYEI